MIINGAILGAVVGLIVVGARVLYVARTYIPGSWFNIDAKAGFAEAPLIWTAFGLPFGAVIGILIGVVFSFLSQYDLGWWPIINGLAGAILGWFITKTLFWIFWELSFSEPNILGGIGNAVLLLIATALFDLPIPGAIIGAIVGLLVKRGGGLLPG